MIEQDKLVIAEQYLKQFGYTDEQWEQWQKNPLNLKIAENAAESQKYKVIAEVVFSHGCLAGHKLGDKIVFGASGTTLLTKENPDRICTYLLQSIFPVIYTPWDKVIAGQDPTNMAQNRIHCPDVGAAHGGTGEVIVEINVVEV